MKTKNWLALTMVPILWSCSKVAFAPAVPVDNKALSSGPTSVTNPVVCQPGQVKVTRPTRVLFLVDQSGSNVNGPYEHPLEATDPTKSFRLSVMNDFVKTNLDKLHVTWGLSVFNDTTSTNLMAGNKAFSSVADFKTAVTTFTARADVGMTPYRAALAQAYQFVNNDMKTAPAETAYMIAFITDGYPTDYCPGSPAEYMCAGRILENDIDNDVRKIQNLNVRNVKFSTVYYGAPDGDATSRLRRMADVGLGEFVDANVSTKVDLNDIMEIQQEICVSNP